MPARAERQAKWIGDPIQQSRRVDQHMVRGAGSRCAEIVDRAATTDDGTGGRAVDEAGRTAEPTAHGYGINVEQGAALPTA